LGDHGLKTWNNGLLGTTQLEDDLKMEPCNEYLACDKKDCIMHGRKEAIRCWKVEGTLCNHPGIRIMRDKLAGMKEDACNRSECIYYKAAKNRNIE